MLPPTQILNKVPEINRTVIQSVLAFLRDMAKHSDKTKMGAANLAMVCFPSLCLRCNNRFAYNKIRFSRQGF